MIGWVTQITDNMCGMCDAWGNGGFKLSELNAGLRFEGASFDDNQIGTFSLLACRLVVIGLT